MKTIIKSWLPVLLWAAIIFLFAANPDPYRFLPASWRSAVPLPSVSDSSLSEWIGQLMHFVEYAVLAFLLSRALFITHQSKISNHPNSSQNEKVNFFKKSTPQHLPQDSERSFRSNTLITISFSMLFALSDEIHQLFVPGRAFQVVDLLIDLLGVLCGVFLYSRLKIEPRSPQRARRKKFGKKF